MNAVLCDPELPEDWDEREKRLQLERQSELVQRDPEFTEPEDPAHVPASGAAVTAAEPITPVTAGLAMLDLEVLVREHLEKVFGWVSLDSVMFALPKDAHDEDEVEQLLFALAERNVVRLTIRPGKSLLVSLVKAGYEPTAEVRPDPPPRPPPRRTIVRPPQLSPAKPTPPPPETQPMSLLTKGEQILEIRADLARLGA